MKVIPCVYGKKQLFIVKQHLTFIRCPDFQYLQYDNGCHNVSVYMQDCGFDICIYQVVS